MFLQCFLFFFQFEAIANDGKDNSVAVEQTIEVFGLADAPTVEVERTRGREDHAIKVGAKPNTKMCSCFPP